MRAKITKKLVDEIKPDTRPVFVFDTDVAGFILKATPTGHRTYQFRYRMGGRNTRLRTYTIAKHGQMTPEQARRTAQALLGDVRRGLDPAEAKKQRAADDKGAPTVATLASEFMELHTMAKRRRRTVTEYDKLLRNVILPTFGTRRIKDITSGEGRKRYLSPDEITRLGQAVRNLEDGDQLSPHLAAFFRLLLLTGMRKDELRLLEWRRVNFERSVLSLEDRLAGC